MSRAQSDHATNVTGAFALVAADEIRQATAQAAGHTDAAPAALTSLYEAPRGRSVDELRRVVGLTPSGGVRLVDRLVADGYVDRRAGADRRNVIVTLTPRGRRAARAVRGARAEAIEQLLRPLTASERTQLSKLMGKLLGARALERLAERQQGQSPPGGWMCRLCDFAACGRDRGACPAAEAVASCSGRARFTPERWSPPGCRLDERPQVITDQAVGGLSGH